MDPSGHEPKYGDGACYEIDCKNANGTPVEDGNGRGGAPKVKGGANNNSDTSDLILVCGFYTGDNCNQYNEDAYGERPLTPYLQLSSNPPVMYMGFPKDEGKLPMAKAIYNLIVSHPGMTYNIVGHSAGGTAVILAVEQLILDGHANQINNIVLLDPWFDTSLESVGGNRNVAILDAANSFRSAGIAVFLGDSPDDGPDKITGSNRFSTEGWTPYVTHTQLATNYDIYNNIVGDENWRP